MANNLSVPLTGAPTDGGSYVVVANFSGDNFYSSATSAPAKFTIYTTPAAITGPSTAVTQQIETFTLWVNNDSQIDQTAVYNYTINWGDGSQTQTISGLAGIQVTHVFTSLGSDNVAITAQGLSLGSTILTATEVVQVVSFALVTDQNSLGLMDLVWGGGQGNNSVVFTQTGADSVQISTSMYNGVAAITTNTVTGVTGKVIAVGGAGNDTIDARRLLTISTDFNGGGGNDTIDGGEGGNVITETSGNNTILSGKGNDTIFISSGDDTIYGGTGNDVINVENGNNFVFGGTGNDIITTVTGNDTIWGGTGNDVFNIGSGNNYVDGGRGNDTITTGTGNDTVYGGYGNDLIKVGNGNNFIEGCYGNDVITTGNGNNLIVGGTGLDTITGGIGDNLIIGGTVQNLNALLSIWSAWQTATIDRHDSIVDITTEAVPIDNSTPDIISPGTGFDVVFNGGTRSVDLSEQVTGIVWNVNTSTELVNALDNAQSGDEVLIAAGTYSYSPTPLDLAGVTITGAGEGKTIILGMFIINNNNNQDPTTISNLSLDQSGLAHVNYYTGAGYNYMNDGTFYLDKIEDYGPGTDPDAAFWFWSSANDFTYAYMSNCYIHDINDDEISDWGGGANLPSQVEVYDTTGVRSGPKTYDQCLTAHNGMPVFVVGGYYADSSNDVVAPQNAITPIDLYFVTIAPGTRSGGIEDPDPASIIYGCTISTTGMYVYGTLEKCTIVASTFYYPAFMNVEINAVVENNTIFNDAMSSYQGVYTAPLRIVGDNATVVDNLFENWDGIELDYYDDPTGDTVFGNTYE